MTGAVAVLEDGAVVAESRVSVAVTHGERLVPTIDGVLRAARRELADIDAFAVAIGPGSFTGLRIGLSTIKGLAFATGKPAVGVPTLDALAWRLPFCAYPICPILDARKKRVSEGVKDAAHKLKSSARSIGANSLADICVALEAAGKTGDWKTIDTLTTQACDAFADVADYINEL